MVAPAVRHAVHVLLGKELTQTAAVILVILVVAATPVLQETLVLRALQAPRLLDLATTLLVALLVMQVLLETLAVAVAGALGEMGVLVAFGK